MARPRKYNEYMISTTINIPVSVFEKIDYLSNKKELSRSALITAILSTAISQDIDDYLTGDVNETNTETKLRDVIKEQVYEKKDRIIISHTRNRGTGTTTRDIVSSFTNILITKIKYELTKKSMSISDKKIKDLISFYIVEIIEGYEGGED